MDHVLCFNQFPLQHIVQRRGSILEALFHILEGFWFGPQDLIMSSLFHFEEKDHRKNLSRVEVIPLLFLRLLSYVLEHLGFPAESNHKHRRDYEATFTLEKWKFVARGPPLPTSPTVEED